MVGVAFCLLGLFFLLVKEPETIGYVEVTVRSGDVSHVVQLRADSPHDVAHARGLVGQAQSMAAAVR